MESSKSLTDFAFSTVFAPESRTKATNYRASAKTQSIPLITHDDCPGQVLNFNVTVCWCQHTSTIWLMCEII